MVWVTKEVLNIASNYTWKVFIKQSVVKVQDWVVVVFSLCGVCLYHDYVVRHCDEGESSQDFFNFFY